MRASLIRSVILVGVAALPGALSAGAAPSEASLSDRLEVRRLVDVRERLERRRALQRNLQVQVDALAAEIEALRVQREQTSAVLQSERQQARVLEQQLDRLVPRLLARMAEVDEKRARAAGVLADLARKSRSLRLDPRIRARMLALGPSMLERLRSLEHGAVSLRGRPDGMIARHAQIARSLPELMSADQRLQHERAHKRRLRQMTSDRLREVALQVRLLGEEQARLARSFLRDDAAMVARAEPRADQPARPDLAGMRASAVQTAAVDKGSADPIAPVISAPEAWSHAAARVVAEASGPGAAVAAAELAPAAGWPTTPPSPELHTQALRRATTPVWPSPSHDAVSPGSALDAVFSLDSVMSGSGTGGARRPRPTPPLLPMLDGADDWALVAHAGPELTIATAPGQAVAAPVEARVAFAGRFKSYGLLLILEHEGEYHTLLWGFARLDVHHGDQVEIGQIVGIMDARGGDPPVLHVERRRNGRPIDIAASSNGIQG